MACIYLRKLSNSTTGGRLPVAAVSAEANVLARKLIGRFFPRAAVIKDSDGRPRVRISGEKAEPGFVSISHSRNLIAVGVARHPIGVDVEKIDSGRLQRSASGLLDALSERIDGCAAVTSRNFYALWTSYEAGLKAGTRLGLLRDRPSSSVVLETLCLQGGFMLSLVLLRDDPPGDGRLGSL